jgi:hypothetical protein
MCNGVIGQAWVIEALALAAEKLEEPCYRSLAKEVFLLHPFDHAVGLWRRVHVSGKVASYDLTFNHQLWFAAAGALLDNDPRGAIGSRVMRFLDRANESYLKVAPSGRIKHLIIFPIKMRKVPRRLHGAVRSIYTLYESLRQFPRHAYMAHKEIGYHAFNAYAFALLKQRIPEHPLWCSRKFHAALEFMNGQEYQDGLEDNKYGYPYNPPGFEVAFAAQVFDSSFSLRQPASWWVEQQLKRSYDTQKQMMSRNTEDETTFAARLYEATRLRDMELQLA